MDGTIDIRSEVGVGTRATVRVPLGPPEPPAAAPFVERRRAERRQTPRDTPDRRRPVDAAAPNPTAVSD